MAYKMGMEISYLQYLLNFNILLKRRISYIMRNNFEKFLMKLKKRGEKYFLMKFNLDANAGNRGLVIFIQNRFHIFCCSKFLQ
jgi:hypothetical protein